jgi:hypothetical protein
MSPNNLEREALSFEGKHNSLTFGPDQTLALHAHLQLDARRRADSQNPLQRLGPGRCTVVLLLEQVLQRVLHELTASVSTGGSKPREKASLRKQNQDNSRHGQDNPNRDTQVPHRFSFSPLA